MNELDVIDVFIEQVENLGYEIETSYGLQDHAPDLVLIDGWNSNRVIRANTTNHSYSFDENDDIVGENHHFYTEMQIELQCRSENELTSVEMRNDIVDHFRKYESDPTHFHDDMVKFFVGNGGPKEPFFEPTSLRVYKNTQSFELEFIDVDVLGEDIGIIEEIDTELEIS